MSLQKGCKRLKLDERRKLKGRSGRRKREKEKQKGMKHIFLFNYNKPFLVSLSKEFLLTFSA